MDAEAEREMRELVRQELRGFEWRVRRIVNDELKNLIDEAGAGVRGNPGASFINEAHSHIARKGQSLSERGH